MVTVHFFVRLGKLKVNIPASMSFYCRTNDIYTKVIYIIHHQNRKQRGRNKRLFDQFESEPSKYSIFRPPVPQVPGSADASIDKVKRWKVTEAEAEAGGSPRQADGSNAFHNSEMSG